MKIPIKRKKTITNTNKLIPNQKSLLMQKIVSCIILGINIEPAVEAPAQSGKSR
jgi:hypothetical protein